MRIKRMIEEWKEFLAQIGVAALFSAFCGLAGYLHKKSKSKEKIVLAEALVRALGSGVTGAILIMACQSMEIDPMTTGAIIGTCGWLGADASVKLLHGIIKRNFKL